MAILIKRYANRKLYNTDTSRYITLKGIAKLLEEGEEVRVIDNETGEDITQVALSQILVDNQRAHEDPSDTLLTQILSRGGDALYGAIKKSVDDATDGLGDFQDRFKQFVQQPETGARGFGRDDRGGSEHRSPFAGNAEAGASDAHGSEGSAPGRDGSNNHESHNDGAAHSEGTDNSSGGRGWPRVSGLPDLRDAIQSAVDRALDGSPLRKLGDLPDFGDFARKSDFDTLNQNLTRVADAIERLEETLRDRDATDD